MTSILICIALFAAVYGAISLLNTDSEVALELYDQPKRAPRPGARDTYAVTGILGRAAVPSWG